MSIVILGIVAIVLSVGLYLIFKYILPSTVQSYADSTKISVDYIDLISVQDKTLDLNINFQINLNIPVSAKSDAANAIVKYNGKPFGTFQIPGYEFDSGKTKYNKFLESKTIITDTNVFTKMGIALVKQNKVALEMEARISTHPMGFLNYDVDFVRELEITSLEQFQNPPPIINNIHLKTCTPSNYIMIINATLDNTSQIGLNGIGAVNLSVYYGDSVQVDKYVGTTVPLNPSLGFPRGLNTYEFEVSMPTSSINLQVLKQMFTDLRSNTARFQLSGLPPPRNQSSNATDIDLFKPIFTEVLIDVKLEGPLGKFTTSPDCNLLSIIGLDNGSDNTDNT